MNQFWSEVLCDSIQSDLQILITWSCCQVVSVWLLHKHQAVRVLPFNKPPETCISCLLSPFVQFCQFSRAKLKQRLTVVFWLNRHAQSVLSFKHKCLCNSHTVCHQYSVYCPNGSTCNGLPRFLPLWILCRMNENNIRTVCSRVIGACERLFVPQRCVILS